MTNDEIRKNDEIRMSKFGFKHSGLIRHSSFVIRHWILFIGLAVCITASAVEYPNVIVIITDDQGHGDLGIHGNPVIRTPNLDRLARESVRCENFYVSPVCAPTRASLLTGRYNYRTGVTDTFLGRAMMHPDETTLAEIFRGAGYRTGIFGKWHLGDNFPMRPMDQGFDESLVHKGGGIAQPSDPPGGDSYFDATLYRNGKAVKSKGYCTDVFTDAAIEFIKMNRRRPFLMWLAYNAPHAPLQLPEKYRAMYTNLDLGRFPTNGFVHTNKVDLETTARVYGMVTCVDDNVGRLMRQIDKLAENTIVVFLTDNGPQQPRYNSGMRERKGSVHDGGIRVPFFVRWPGRLSPGREVTELAAHIDLLPTLLEACSVSLPANLKLDGRSLWPLLTGQRLNWPARTVFFQWHRGDGPELNRACAARSDHYKLVQALGVNAPSTNAPTFKLFDMRIDPFERNDIAAAHPEIVERLRGEYGRWFKDVSSTRGYGPVRMHVGAAQENPVQLTRQDWRGPRAGWNTNSIGHWEVLVTRGGDYEVTVDYPALPEDATLRLAIDGTTRRAEVSAGNRQFIFPPLLLDDGPARVAAWLTIGERSFGAHYVTIRRLELR
jgi:arylsulfatase A-like enzyme